MTLYLARHLPAQRTGWEGRLDGLKDKLCKTFQVIDTFRTAGDSGRDSRARVRTHVGHMRALIHSLGSRRRTLIFGGEIALHKHLSLKNLAQI